MISQKIKKLIEKGNLGIAISKLEKMFENIPNKENIYKDFDNQRIMISSQYYENKKNTVNTNTEKILTKNNIRLQLLNLIDNMDNSNIFREYEVINTQINELKFQVNDLKAIIVENEKSILSYKSQLETYENSIDLYSIEQKENEISQFKLQILNLTKKNKEFSIKNENLEQNITNLEKKISILEDEKNTLSEKIKRLEKPLQNQNFIEKFGSTTFQMIFIKGGKFIMGSNELINEMPLHEVLISDFYLAEFPITVQLWNTIMGIKSNDKKNEKKPKTHISWYDAQKFIEKLNELTGKKYRLPTEAEWEYAAGGGSIFRTKWCGTNDGEELIKYAWYKSNSNNQIQEVGLKRANKLGIYDMSGNIWEWCEDWYFDKFYQHCAIDNPVNLRITESKVLRGGSVDEKEEICRITNRGNWNPNNHIQTLGFRLAHSLF